MDDPSWALDKTSSKSISVRHFAGNQLIVEWFRRRWFEGRLAATGFDPCIEFGGTSESTSKKDVGPVCSVVYVKIRATTEVLTQRKHEEPTTVPSLGKL